MIHLKTYEKYGEDTNYLIPTYPLNKYFIALKKLKMSDEDLYRWQNNQHAQYWNNSHFKYIIMMYSLENGWSWTEYNKSFFKNKEIIPINIENWEIDADKYNL